MSDAKPEIREYRLTTAEIIYHLPDHPDLLQSFVWQKLDLAPEFPELRRFLDFARPGLLGGPDFATSARRSSCIRERPLRRTRLP